MILYLLISIMVVLWSANFIAAKIALRELPPLLLSGMRVVLAGAIMTPLYWWESRRPDARGSWSRADVPLLIVLGIFGVGLNQLFFVLGIARTTVAHSALLIGTTPICVLIMAAAVKLERMTALKICGMALALGGVALLQVGKSGAGASQPTLAGDVLTFFAALTFALFTVLGKRVTERYSSITVTTFAYLGAAAAMAPVTLWEARKLSFAAISWGAWAGLVYMALFSSVICYLIYYYALTRIAASRVAAFSYLQPLLATVMAAGLLGERVTTAVVAGGSIIFAGVLLTERG